MIFVNWDRLKSMFKLWKKNESKKEEAESKKGEVVEEGKQTLTWSDQAKQALEQAVGQAPVPKLMKGQIKKQLASAAEEAAKAAGHTEVSAEDLMNGLMAKLPDNMRNQVEKAAKQGPDGLKNLEKKLKGK